MSKALYSRSVDPDSDDDIAPQKFTYTGSVDPGYDGVENNILQQSIFCTNKDMKTYPFIDNGKSILIVIQKLTKNRSRIISDISIPSSLPHLGIHHRFILNTNLSSMSDKNKRLLYKLIEILLFIGKITVPEVHACISYIITRMILLSLSLEKDHLQVDVLSMKKL